jgi:hypothetical protein
LLKKIGVILAILAIAVVALGLRLYRFSPPSTLTAYTIDPTLQLPPGLHSDEAYNALGGWRILHTGQWSPYSDIDQGRSVAHMTLTAAVIALAGPLAESARLTSLIAGLISVAATVWLVQALFSAQLPVHLLRVLQLIAAGEVAATYWFVNFSRAGFELITLPMFMIPAFAAMWQWLHRPTWPRTLLAGVLLGATLYTYYAAYIVPALAVLSSGLYFWSKRRNPPVWRYWLIYLLIGGLMALPLGLYALDRPDIFWHRLSDTAASTEVNLLDNALRTLGGLAFSGDLTVAYNLPARPLLDPIQLALGVIGLLLCLRRVKQPEFLFVPVWALVLMLPAMLSVGAPAFNRLAGAVPAILLLVALGGAQLYQWLSRLRWKWLAPVVLTAVLVFTTLQTAYAYFELWPRAKGLLNAFSVSERIQAEVIQAQAGTQTMYLSPSDNQRSIFSYLWQQQPLAISFNGRRCTVMPQTLTRDTSWVVNLSEDKRTLERLSALYPQIESHPVWVNTGTTVVTQLALPADLTAQVPTTTLATVGDLFQLRDYHLIEPPVAGGRLRARLLWQPIGSTPDDWIISTYLSDAAGQIYAQDDRQPCDGSYPTSRWQPSDLVSDDRTLTLPEDWPAGNYQLAIVFYRLSDGARLPIHGPAGESRGEVLILDTIAVP